jgi:hypothetical protein
MLIDYKALDRVVGPHVAERFGLASEDFTDGADAYSLLAMAVEQAEASGQSIAETMTILLDTLARERESA